MLLLRKSSQLSACVDLCSDATTAHKPNTPCRSFMPSWRSAAAAMRPTPTKRCATAATTSGSLCRRCCIVRVVACQYRRHSSVVFRLNSSNVFPPTLASQRASYAAGAHGPWPCGTRIHSGRTQNSSLAKQCGQMALECALRIGRSTPVPSNAARRPRFQRQLVSMTSMHQSHGQSRCRARTLVHVPLGQRRQLHWRCATPFRREEPAKQLSRASRGQSTVEVSKWLHVNALGH